jgi:cytochrome c5
MRLTTLTLVVLSLGVGLAWTQTEDAAALKARMAKLDAGPKTIDVAKYPADMQTGYALFQKKCSKCHTTARAINSHFVLPGEWERYIKRMVYKPDSKMTDDDGKAIYKFLVYDSSVRKADSLRVHLGNLPASEREVAITKVKALNASFQPTK